MLCVHFIFAFHWFLIYTLNLYAFSYITPALYKVTQWNYINCCWALASLHYTSSPSSTQCLFNIKLKILWHVFEKHFVKVEPKSILGFSNRKRSNHVIYLHLLYIFFFSAHFLFFYIVCSVFHNSVVFSFYWWQLHCLETISVSPCILLDLSLSSFLWSPDWWVMLSILWSPNSNELLPYPDSFSPGSSPGCHRLTSFSSSVLSASLLYLSAACTDLLKPQFWIEKMRVRQLHKLVGSLQERWPWISTLLKASVGGKGTKSLRSLLRKRQGEP